MGKKRILKTNDNSNNTLIWVTIKKASQIVKDQIDCMGCLSQCLFSNYLKKKMEQQEKKQIQGHFVYKRHSKK